MKGIKKAKSVMNLIGLLIILPIGMAGTFLLYQHVHAPSIVWILWIINLPILVIYQVINAIVTKDVDK